MRGGFLSSSSVSGAGIFMSVEPYCDAGHRLAPRLELIGVPVGFVGCRRGCMHGAAEETGLELLIGADAGRIYYVRAIGATGPGWPIRAIATRARRWTGDKPAVVPPVEAEPRPALPRLILQVSGLVEFFVVVDAERRKFPRHRNDRNGARPADLRREETRGDAGHHHVCREAVEVGHVHAAVNPGIFELCHSIGNVIGVLPSTLKSYALCVYFQMYSPSKTTCFPNACCKPGMKFIAKAGTQIGVSAPEVHEKQRRQDRDRCIRCWKARDFH